MLKDLLEDLHKVKQSTPRKVVEILITDWYSEQGSDEEKQQILAYAKENNLEFLLPSDWFDDYVEPRNIKKADESKEDEESEKKEVAGDNVDTDTIVFTYKTDKETAEVVREFFDILKKIHTQNLNVELDFVQGSEKFKSIVLEAKNTKVIDSEEDYNRPQDMAKADLIIKFSGSGNQQEIEDLLSAIRDNNTIILDPASDNSKYVAPESEGFNFEFIDDFTIAANGDVSHLIDVLTGVKSLAESRTQFPVYSGDEQVVYWSGDFNIESLEKSETTQITPNFISIFHESYSPVRNTIFKLQEELAPFGVIVSLEDLQVVSLYFQEDVRTFVALGLDKLGLSNKVVQDIIDKNGISIVSLDLTREVKLDKATKGGEGYEEWLRKYREKRSKNKKDKDIERQIDALSKVFNKKSVVDRMQDSMRAFEREESVSRLLGDTED